MFSSVILNGVTKGNEVEGSFEGFLLCTQKCDEIKDFCTSSVDLAALARNDIHFTDVLATRRQVIIT